MEVRGTGGTKTQHRTGGALAPRGAVAVPAAAAPGRSREQDGQFGALAEGGAARPLAWPRRLDTALAFAAQADAGLSSPEQAVWLERLEQRYPLFDRLLRRLVDGGQAAPAVRLATLLWRFWSSRGRQTEGRAWIGRIQALEGFAAVAPAARAELLTGAGNLAYQQGDYAATLWLSEQNLAFWTELGDARGMATALHGAGSAHQRLGALGSARECLQRAVAINRRAGNLPGAAACLRALGSVCAEQGDLPAARRFLEESLALRERLQDPAGVAAVLHALGDACLRMGDRRAARLMHEKSHAIRRQLGDLWGAAHSLESLAQVAQLDGSAAAARTLRDESAALKAKLGDRSPPREGAPLPTP